MDFKEIIGRNPHLTLPDLQELQRTYDEQFVATKGFVGFDKVRHTYAHMGKLLGRLAEYIHEMEEHPDSVSDVDVRTKVIPDLLVYAAWLSGVFDVDEEQAYLTRFVGNIKRLNADKFPEEKIRELEVLLKERFEVESDS